MYVSRHATVSAHRKAHLLIEVSRYTNIDDNCDT